MYSTSSNSKGIPLNCISKDLLEPIFYGICDIGTLSRCRRVCTDFNQLFAEKKIFERCLTIYTPEKKMLDHWKSILSAYDQNHPYFSSFFGNILTNNDNLISIDFEFFYKIFPIIKNEKDPVRLSLLQHTLQISLKAINSIFAPVAFLQYYKALETSYKPEKKPEPSFSSNASLCLDFFKSLIGKQKYISLEQILSKLPKENVIQIKKETIDLLDDRIRSYNSYESTEKSDWCFKLLDALILLTNDRNIEVASRAHDILEKLIASANRHQALTFSHFVLIKEHLSIAYTLCKAIIIQSTIHGISFLTIAIQSFFELEPLLKNASFSSIFVRCAIMTALLLNTGAIVQFVSSIKQCIEYETRFDSNSVRSSLMLFGVTNLSLLMSYLFLGAPTQTGSPV